MKSLLASFLWIAVAGLGLAAPPTEFRHYYLEATCISLDEGQTLDSYRREGSVSGSVGSTIGVGNRGIDHPVAVSIRPLRKVGRFLAEVTFDPAGEDEKRVENVDLSDLHPKVLDLTTDADGRRYHLSLIPTVEIIDTHAKPFREAGSDLYTMQFNNGAILLNDKRYIGRMSASDAEFFSIDICDVASIEFSLHHLKDAKPWGNLKEGRLVITNPETGVFFELNGVTNGPDEQVVSGGPYQVWVRWREPNTSCDAMRAELKKLKKKIDAGEFSGRPGMAEHIDAELARDPGPWVVGSGARGVRPSELVHE